MFINAKRTSHCSELCGGLEPVVRKAIEVLEGRTASEVPCPISVRIACVWEEVVCFVHHFLILYDSEVATWGRIHETHRKTLDLVA